MLDRGGKIATGVSRMRRTPLHDVVAGPSAEQDYSARCASPKWGRPNGRSAALRAAVRSAAAEQPGQTKEGR
jgi:hypothetical protein